jgi:hypothetical protein
MKFANRLLGLLPSNLRARRADSAAYSADHERHAAQYASLLRPTGRCDAGVGFVRSTSANTSAPDIVPAFLSGLGELG